MFIGLDNLFLSVDMFASRWEETFSKLQPYYYDYIVIDEAHHSTANSYRELFNHFKPKILLGLTATPERMDGRDVLSYFDGRISAEIRLPEAINRQLLVPFQYFGVSDTADLQRIAWERGGYKKSELTRIYAIDEISRNIRADNILKSCEKYITNIDKVKGLGFCVSIEHANFMADYFNKQGISSISLNSSSKVDERFSAKEKLVKGEIKFCS